MKHNIIQTKNYLLVVDDKKPIINSYYNESEGKVDSIEFTPTVIGGTIIHNIKAHLPLNNSPILAGIDLLPPLEDDDSKDLFYRKQVMNPYSTESQSYTAYEKGFIEGYNTAKEKYKYTEEDLIKVWVAGMRFIGEDKGSYKEIIQSLQQPKPPVAFDCEENIFLATNAFCTDVSLTSDGLKDTILRSPKTTINSQGIIQWIGKYIYE
jgi:hypothetical protein